MARKTRAYGLQRPLEDVFPVPIVAARAPTTSDTNFDLGQLWIYTTTGQIYGLANVASGSATWSGLGPGASDVDTLTGDSGGAISPVAGNITMTGGTNLTTVGTAGTITFNLDAAITLATSVTAPLFTAAAGADTKIEAPSGQDIVFNMSTNDGSTYVLFTDSDDATVFSVDSNGGITYTGLSNTGTFTTAGGAASINASSNFNTVINSGTSTGTVTVGNSAAGAVTIDSGAGISIDSATASNFTVTGATQDLTLASTGGSVKINATEDAAGAIALTANGGTSETVTITSSQGTGVGSVTLDSTAGGITLSAALASADAINLAASAGGVDIDGALQVNIASSQNAADAVRINASAGGIDIDAAGAAGEDIDIANAAGSVNLTSGEAVANSIVLSSTSGGIDILCPGAGAGLDIDIVNTGGSVNVSATEADAAAISLQAASGGLDIDTGLAIIADAAGNVEINSSAGQILIGNDDVDQNASFATDGERTVTVGSTNGAAALVLQGGTGKITMTGTVKEITSDVAESNGVWISEINASPLMTTAANTGGVATGTTGATNLMALQNGIIMEQFILGAGQTIIAPRMDTNGLLISLDLTATEGAEYNFGARDLSKCAFTIGTDAAFYFEVGLYINDMDGADPYIIGFRKSEANNATFGNYTDYAAIGMIASTSATNIVTVDELNGGGQTITNTTDAWGGDGSTNTLRVLVSAAGVVTYTINGVAPTAAGAITFDNADVVIPFIRLTHSASPTQVNITSIKCGYQA